MQMSVAIRTLLLGAVAAFAFTFASPDPAQAAGRDDYWDHYWDGNWHNYRERHLRYYYGDPYNGHNSYNADYPGSYYNGYHNSFYYRSPRPYRTPPGTNLF
jgi:hypothetical protein